VVLNAQSRGRIQKSNGGDISKLLKGGKKGTKTDGSGLGKAQDQSSVNRDQLKSGVMKILVNIQTESPHERG